MPAPSQGQIIMQCRGFILLSEYCNIYDPEWLFEFVGTEIKYRQGLMSFNFFYFLSECEPISQPACNCNVICHNGWPIPIQMAGIYHKLLKLFIYLYDVAWVVTMIRLKWERSTFNRG